MVCNNRINNTSAGRVKCNDNDHVLRCQCHCRGYNVMVRRQDVYDRKHTEDSPAAVPPGSTLQSTSHAVLRMRGEEPRDLALNLASKSVGCGGGWVGGWVSGWLWAGSGMLVMEGGHASIACAPIRVPHRPSPRRHLPRVRVTTSQGRLEVATPHALRLL